MSFVGNLLLFAAVKEFGKSIKNWQSYSHGYGGTLFLTHGVVILRLFQKSLSCVTSYQDVLVLCLHCYWDSIKSYFTVFYYCNLSTNNQNVMTTAVDL